MTTPTPDKKTLRLVFAGTPEFAAQHLDTLINSDYEVIAVYTQPDKRAGRGRKSTSPPVKLLAEAHNIEVKQPLSLKDPEEQSILKALNPDIMVVVAYGQILPQAVLDIPKFGCLNVHASILPRWRGAAPIERSILAGDKVTGVTIMQMDAGLDTGDMLNKVETDIQDHETAKSLHDKLITLGTPALMKTLNEVATKTLSPESQDSTLASYASKISKEEGALDWSLSAEHIYRQLRSLNCFSFIETQRVRLWASSIQQHLTDSNSTHHAPGSIVEINSEKHIVIACGQGLITIDKAQLPGKKALSTAELLNGNADLFTPGMTFSSNV